MPTIVITNPCPSETGGGMWNVGQTVSASDTYARMLIGRGDAYDPTGALVDVGVGPADLAAAVDNKAKAAQFGTVQRLLPTVSYGVAATGRIPVGPCAVAGVYCVAPGSSGNIQINDAADATDATLIRFLRAYSACVAGTYYPLVSASKPAALLMATGCYVTVPSSGVYVVDLIDGASLLGLEGSGMLATTARLTATGQALYGHATLLSAYVVATGSSGNFNLFDDTGASVSGQQRYPTTAYSSLTAGQVIEFGPAGGGMRLANTYATIPGSGIVLLHHLPR